MKKTRWIQLVACMAVNTLLCACGDSSDSDSSADTGELASTSDCTKWQGKFEKKLELNPAFKNKTMNITCETFLDGTRFNAVDYTEREFLGQNEQAIQKACEDAIGFAFRSSTKNIKSKSCLLENMTVDYALADVCYRALNINTLEDDVRKTVDRVNIREALALGFFKHCSFLANF